MYIHSTFQTCPFLFTQLFTINGLIIYSWVTVSAPVRPTGTYISQDTTTNNRFFTYLKEEMQNLDLQLARVSVMGDFELALVQSLKLQFPVTFTSHSASPTTQALMSTSDCKRHSHMIVHGEAQHEKKKVPKLSPIYQTLYSVVICDIVTIVCCAIAMRLWGFNKV